MKKLLRKIYFKLNEKEYELIFKTIGVLMEFVHSYEWNLAYTFHEQFYQDVISLYNSAYPIFQKEELGFKELKMLKKNLSVLLDKFEEIRC